MLSVSEGSLGVSAVDGGVSFAASSFFSVSLPGLVASGFSTVAVFVVSDGAGGLRGVRRADARPLLVVLLGAGFGASAGSSGFGVGAAATSAGGSSMRAPTDDTLVTFLSLDLEVAWLGSAVRVSVSSGSGPLIGSNDPLKRI